MDTPVASPALALIEALKTIPRAFQTILEHSDQCDYRRLFQSISKCFDLRLQFERCLRLPNLALQLHLAKLFLQLEDLRVIVYVRECLGLACVVEGTEKLVSMFNDSFGGGTEQLAQIDLEAIRSGAGGSAALQTTYLVDMGKAEALVFMGERRAAVELAERHL